MESLATKKMPVPAPKVAPEKPASRARAAPGWEHTASPGTQQACSEGHAGRPKVGQIVGGTWAVGAWAGGAWARAEAGAATRKQTQARIWNQRASITWESSTPLFSRSAEGSVMCKSEPATLRFVVFDKFQRSCPL